MIIALLIIIVLFFLILLVCFKMAYYVSPSWKFDSHHVSSQEAYQLLKDDILEIIDYLEAVPFQWVYITSRDGLRLAARYYEQDPSAPTHIGFHGYRSGPTRDCAGIFRMSLESGYNILLPDMRAHGESQGRVISMGIMERYDCVDWVNYILERNGQDSKLLLSGCSMGAATVMMAAELLPPQVKAMSCDCGYTSPRDILQAVCKSMHLPTKPAYFFLRLAGRIFGGFDTEAATAPGSLSRSSIPLFIAHGQADSFVPCYMSRENFQASAAEIKYIYTVPGAEHGLSFLVDRSGYKAALLSFLEKTDFIN